MAINKFTVLLPLTLMMLGASAVPVSSPADGPRAQDHKAPGPSPQRRGYDGDWLYSRSGDSVEVSVEGTPRGKAPVVVKVNGELKVIGKRDDDDDDDDDVLYARDGETVEVSVEGLPRGKAPVVVKVNGELKVIGKRGYEEDGLYARDGETVDASVEGVPRGKAPVVVKVNGELKVIGKRGYDGDWLYSRQNAEAAEAPSIDAQK